MLYGFSQHILHSCFQEIGLSYELCWSPVVWPDTSWKTVPYCASKGVRQSIHFLALRHRLASENNGLGSIQVPGKRQKCGKIVKRMWNKCETNVKEISSSRDHWKDRTADCPKSLVFGASHKGALNTPIFVHYFGVSRNRLEVCHNQSWSLQGRQRFVPFLNVLKSARDPQHKMHKDRTGQNTQNALRSDGIRWHPMASDGTVMPPPPLPFVSLCHSHVSLKWPSACVISSRHLGSTCIHSEIDANVRSSGTLCSWEHVCSCIWCLVAV